MPKFNSKEEYEQWKAQRLEEAKAKHAENNADQQEGAQNTQAGQERIYQVDGGEISEDEYIAYIGKNTEKYLDRFSKFRLSGIDKFIATWHWPAFLAGGGWFLYRKMYLWWIVSVIVSIFIPLLPQIAMGMSAYYLYYKRVNTDIIEIKSRSYSTDTRADILERIAAAGGVNRWVITVAIICLALVIIGILAAIIIALVVPQKSRIVRQETVFYDNARPDEETAPTVTSDGLEMDTNRPGKDFSSFDLPEADPTLCQQTCKKVPLCKAFTYVEPGLQGRNPRCWLKTEAPPPVTARGCVSGVIAE